MPPFVPRLFGAALSIVAAFILSVPPILHMTIAAAGWLFITDWFTGIAAAALRPGERVSSSAMRLKMKTKLLCYFQILSLGGAVSLMSQSWLVFTAAWGSIAASEGFSIIENIRESATASEMAPVRAFLDRLMPFLTAGTNRLPDPPGPVPSLPAAPSLLEAKDAENA